MSSSRHLFRLLQVLLPVVACGGTSSSETSSTSQSTGGTAGSSTGGAGGQISGGAAGSSEAGSGGAAGTAGSGATAGSAGTGGTAGTAAWSCQDAPLLPDQDTGFFRCTDGSIHRTEAKTCPSKLPTAAVCGDPSGDPLGSCKMDADCKDAPNGYCMQSFGGAGIFCNCSYGCTSDQECQSGQICACGDSIGVCVTTTCVTDADCGVGSACLSYTVASACSASSLGFACTTAGDECKGDADCPPAGSSGFPMYCGHDGTKRTCLETPPACPGRPLVIAARMRMAGLHRGQDGWS